MVIKRLTYTIAFQLYIVWIRIVLAYCFEKYSVYISGDVTRNVPKVNINNDGTYLDEITKKYNGVAYCKVDALNDIEVMDYGLPFMFYGIWMWLYYKILLVVVHFGNSRNLDAR